MIHHQLTINDKGHAHTTKKSKFWHIRSRLSLWYYI